MRTPHITFVITALLLASACGSSPAPPPVAAAGKPVDAATAGAITGRVVFQGTPPPIGTVQLGIDKACVGVSGATVPSDAVLIGPDGALQNAFVYVKEGLDPAYTFDTPTAPVLIDQKGCRYTPRILGVRAGQSVKVVNSDDTLHNVHALPMTNQEFNIGQRQKDPPLLRTFTVPEVMVRFKCDVHGWMTAYIGVMAHPFFAVTAADGTFEIKGLPPGSYTVGAWHEKFGTQTVQVTVADRQTQTASFTFAAK